MFNYFPNLNFQSIHWVNQQHGQASKNNTPLPGNSSCLSQYSIVMKRHHDNVSTYKEIHLIGTGLLFQKFNIFLSWQEAWQHADRYDVGEVAERSTSRWAGGKKRETLGQA